MLFCHILDCQPSCWYRIPVPGYKLGMDFLNVSNGGGFESSCVHSSAYNFSTWISYKLPLGGVWSKKRRNENIIIIVHTCSFLSVWNRNASDRPLEGESTSLWKYLSFHFWHTSLLVTSIFKEGILWSPERYTLSQLYQGNEPRRKYASLLPLLVTL